MAQGKNLQYEATFATVHSLASHSASRHFIHPEDESQLENPFSLIRLSVSNLGGSTHASHPIDVRLSGQTISSWFVVPDLAPGQSVVLSRPLKTITEQIDHVSDLLSRQIEPTVEPVELFAGSSSVGTGSTLLIPPNSWSHTWGHRPLVASFVKKDDRDVTELVWPLRQHVKAVLNERSLSRKRERTREAVRALYDSLTEHCTIRYEPPADLERHPQIGTSYQRVRGVDEVLRPMHGSTGLATCLDLAVLFAACLEAMEFAPVVLFGGDSSTDPDHAFVGCWTDCREGPGAILDNAPALRDDIQNERLFVFEATGICSQAEFAQTFDCAIESAERLVTHRAVHGIDILRSRRFIRPLAPFASPVVSRAFASAVEFQRERGIEQLSASLVLYGLAKESRDLFRTLLEAAGASPREVVAAIESKHPPRERIGRGRETSSYRDLWTDCWAFATEDGRTPRESDLLWAIARSRSVGVADRLKEMGLSRLRFTELLEELGPGSVPGWGATL